MTTPQDLAAQIEALAEVTQADRDAGALMFRTASGWSFESEAERMISDGRSDSSPFVVMFAKHRVNAIVAAIRQGEGERAAWQRVSDELDHVPNGMHADLEDAASAMWDFFPDGVVVKGTGQYIDECVECVGTGCSATEKPCAVCKGSGIKPGSVWRSTMAPPAPDARDDEVRNAGIALPIAAIKMQNATQDEHLPSSVARDQGLVWLEGWFDLCVALSPAKGGE